MSGAQINFLDEIIVDNFAGGGGASTGIELATGRVVDIAVNHDPDAILMHKTNHPHTRHFQASVWDVDPVEVCQGRPVGLAWFSPDCKHFSKAKGGKPVDKNIRGLAWIVLRWAGTVRPQVGGRHCGVLRGERDPCFLQEQSAGAFPGSPCLCFPVGGVSHAER